MQRSSSGALRSASRACTFVSNEVEVVVVLLLRHRDHVCGHDVADAGVDAAGGDAGDPGRGGFAVLRLDLLGVIAVVADIHVGGLGLDAGVEDERLLLMGPKGAAVTNVRQQQPKETSSALWLCPRQASTGVGVMWQQWWQ